MSTATTPAAAVLVAGKWQPSSGNTHFQSSNPAENASLPELFPISPWSECEAMLDAAHQAALELRTLPRQKISDFLNVYADLLETHRDALAEVAHRETALPIKPRLADVELPRTSGQLRQAAAACLSGSWAMPTIDTKQNIRSCLEPIGPVVVFGPNNFPFAFNSVAGGDFAAAIAAGNPVIGKANTSHPLTTQRLAELALQAVLQTGLPTATVQLLYRLSHADGERLVSDPRIGAVGYTGSRSAGLTLKKAADLAGIPIYLELSSVNPVVILESAFEERSSAVTDEFVTSVLMGTGQFCTNPGLILAVDSPRTEEWLNAVVARFNQAPVGTLLSSSVRKSLTAAIETMVSAGAQLLCGGTAVDGRCSVSNTLLRTSGAAFIADPHTFQTEAFGNASLVVTAESVEQLVHCIHALEGNLTGCIYSSASGGDENAYHAVAASLSRRVGRLLNDKMPTGVAVSPAMNHGGPFPATGHPGFTAVGIPASMVRFGKLTCYDNVRDPRLPELLRNRNPTGKTWRLVDLAWTQESLS